MKKLSTFQGKAATFLVLLSAAFPLLADYSDRQEVQVFIDEMVQEEGIDRLWMEQLFQEAQYSQSVIDAITRPAEKTLNWAEYQKIFLTPARLERGLEFWEENAEVLEQAVEHFGVPAEVVLAIIGVETFYGRYTGGYRVIDSLSTLAFDYPPRGQFFLGELRSLVLLANQHAVEPASLTGSYAGAMGLGQFIPSSYLAYSSDYDGDGFADLWNNPADAIWSVANYLTVHGWHRNEPVFERIEAPLDISTDLLNQDLKPYLSLDDLSAAGISNLEYDNYRGEVTLMQLEGVDGLEYWIGHHNFYVITRYNHSHLYAMAVAQLAAQIRAGRNATDI